MIRSAEAFIESLVKAGVLSDLDTIQRVVIDAKVGDLVVIHVQRIGDSRLLNAVLTLDGVEIRCEPDFTNYQVTDHAGMTVVPAVEAGVKGVRGFRAAAYP